MSTPLYDALKEYAAENPLRLHMPGHKGKALSAPELEEVTALDVTELPPTGNLYEFGEPFESAQALWAERFQADCCQFLTGGSTMGIHTGLTLLCRPGDRVLIDRSCHRAVYNAMALLDLRPEYLSRPWLAEEGIAGPIGPAQVEDALEKHPDVKAVCITSPTYCGVLSYIGDIARLLHSRGIKLMVDGAHGAHLPFLGEEAAFAGADAVVVSAHKTLSALGQGALLFTRGMDPERVRRAASIYGTSSPSYPILASLDLAREELEGKGIWSYRRALQHTARLRERFPSLGGSALPLDPARLTLKVKDGPAFTRELEARGIFPEMEDGGHVVMICTGRDSDEDFLRLEEALEELRDRMGDSPPLPRPPLPERALSPREALFAPAVTRLLEDCEGKISAGQIAPYPPGVPVAAPGEIISKKELAYLREIGYNMKKFVWVTR